MEVKEEEFVGRATKIFVLKYFRLKECSRLAWHEKHCILKSHPNKLRHLTRGGGGGGGGAGAFAR